MTHIPGTSQPKPKVKIEEQKVEPKLIGLYKKEDMIQKKISAKSTTWYLDQKYWIRAGMVISLISIILGFLIYKSFFILALFVPIGLLVVWFIVKFFEATISKLDSFEK